jgi:chemotaxis protein methyltransferase WspC
MNLDPVVELLGRRIGLDAASLGPHALGAAVAERMRAAGLTDPAAYAGLLAGSAEELEALVEWLVVPETWFFRGGLFGELARVAAGSPRPFRALSVPCSSGEEPYSLAIALLEAGYPGRWAIDGIDLSPRLLGQARRGVYREFSFRQTDPGLRARYFRPAAGGWELDGRVRAGVRFRAGNLADPALLAGESGVYDLILCRNLLIYLTAGARSRALDTLTRLLAPGGLLAVGHAEPQMLAGRPFARAGAEPYFLFRHEPAGTHPRAPERLPPPPPAAPPMAGKLQPPTPAAPAPAGGVLDRARELADAGRLDEALAQCRAHLGGGMPSADAYSLLGVIHQARGETGAAADAFRKALYLDPDHREALVHAMLLSAQRGDADRAAVLRRRLARVAPGGEP